MSRADRMAILNMGGKQENSNIEYSEDEIRVKQNLRVRISDQVFLKDYAHTRSKGGCRYCINQAIDEALELLRNDVKRRGVIIESLPEIKKRKSKNNG